MKLEFPPRTLLHIYFQVISIITLGLMAIGAALLIRVSFSYLINIPFAYSLPKTNSYEDYIKYEKDSNQEFSECYTGKPIEFYNRTFCFDSSQRKTELITGISLFSSMLILFLVHRFFINKEKSVVKWLQKAYVFISLIIYSIVGIITLPFSIYLLTNYLLYEPSTDMYMTPSQPAMSLSIALIAIPFWVYFLIKTNKIKKD